MPRPSTIPAALLAAGCVLLAAACGTEREARAASTGPLAVASTVPGWAFRQAAIVGADGDSETTLFGVMNDVQEDAEGNFYVLNFGDKRVLVFDRDGRHLRTVGRKGRGPGELQAPASAALVGDDALFVLDATLSTLVEYSRSTGKHVRNVPLDRKLGFAMDAHPAGDGAVAVKFEPVSPGQGAGTRPVVMRVSVSDGRATPLVQLDSLLQVVVTGPKPGAQLVEPPFAPRPVWTVAPDGTVLFGNGARYEVKRAGPGGTGVLFQASAPAARVTAADRRGYQEANPVLDSVGRKMDFPETKPYFSNLMADPRGGVWVQVPSSDPGQRWEVRSATGEKRGEVRLPERARIAGLTGTSLYVVRNDADDQEILHRLAREDAR
ncbi:MAG TPA: 6-bladed beta-propeller [Longimicrobium sp.]|nr:6-bladed beta-propeller [Longimicrobium sp.]